MKRLLNSLITIGLLSLFLITSSSKKTLAQDVVVSFQTFYDELSPYGQWVYDPQYGNVWVPNEGGDFRPYGSRGHWVMTDYGNTWMSEDPWGWAVYHYGRWTYDPYYGWIWIPGYEWAPAWVSWRYGGGYCGWAPLGPLMSVGVTIGIPTSWWVFVGPQYMYEPNCIHYWRGPSYNTTYIHQTTIINNYYVDNGTHVRYNYGPRSEAIQQVTHQPVQVYRMQQMNRPGAASLGHNTVSMYRPSVNRASAGNARPTNVMQAPRQIGSPAAATNVNASHQPEFRQEVMKRNPEVRGGAPAGNPRGNQPQMENRPGDRSQPARSEPVTRPQQPPVRNEPMGRPQQPGNQPMNRPQPPVRNEPIGRPQQPMQPMDRPQPQMHNEPMGRPQQPMQPMNRPQPQMHNEPMNRPQPQMQQPMNRPQPQMQQPMNRPQPQMQQPMNRPQPQMQQPMNRPQPQMQQPMNRPQPQMQQPMNRPQPQAPQPVQQPHGAPQGQPHQEHPGGRR